jgi:hypothetical protein
MASSPAVNNQAVRKTGPLFSRHQFTQVALDLNWIFASGQIQTA